MPAPELGPFSRCLAPTFQRKLVRNGTRVSAGGQPDSVRAVHGAFRHSHCLGHPRHSLGELLACIV